MRIGSSFPLQNRKLQQASTGGWKRIRSQKRTAAPPSPAHSAAAGPRGCTSPAPCAPRTCSSQLSQAAGSGHGWASLRAHRRSCPRRSALCFCALRMRVSPSSLPCPQKHCSRPPLKSKPLAPWVSVSAPCWLPPYLSHFAIPAFVFPRRP